MSYFKPLCQHLIVYLERKGTTLVDKFSAWREDAELIPDGKGSTDGTVVAMFRYQLVIDVEQIPTDIVDSSVLMARLIAWLGDHDEHRLLHNLEGPKVEIDDFTGAGTASIEFRVPMIEPISLVPAPDGQDGDVEYGGKQWNVGKPVIRVAVDGDLEYGRPKDEATT